MRRRSMRLLLWAYALVALMCALPRVAYSQSAADPSPLGGIARRLADDGVSLNAAYVGEFAANPVGGERQGAAYNDEISFGATFDLDKLTNLTGGSLQVLFTKRDGGSISRTQINNSISVQEKYGDGQTFQMTFLVYTQELFGGLIETRIGRDDITYNFALQPGACLYFQSFAICDNPSATALDVNDGSSYWPEAVWGGSAKFNPTPNVYAKVGVYEDQPDLNPRIDHGFDWSGRHGNGVQIGAEVGYTNTPPGAQLPDRYALGAIYDLGRYAAPYYSSTSQYGRGLIYLQFNKIIYRRRPDSPQGLYFLGGLYFGTAGESQKVGFEWQAAALYFGLIPSRPNDNLGFQITGLKYNRDLLDAHYQERLAAGGTDYPHGHMTMAELNYTIRLTPWISLTPNLQYVRHPDGLGGLPYPKANLPSALVIGAQLEIDLDKWLGLRPK